MAAVQYWKNFRIESPARYRIRVRGQLDTDWSDRLAGMSVRVTASPDGTRITRLTGRLSDQAALAGVLNTLYDLHLPLLSVNNLDEPVT